MTRYAQGGLTRFDTGGTHEQNPLGGINIGNNNSVEENETKSGNFVYSNRIFLDSNIVSQYNLPKSLIGKSVADATKMIDDKFKGRNDKISQSTKNGMLSKIAEAQEAMKPQEPEMEQPQEGMEQGYPQEMMDPSQMALGGYVNRQMDGGGYYDQNNPYFMQNPGVQQSGMGPMNQIQPLNQLSQANGLSQIKPFSTNNQLPTVSTVPDTAGAIGGGFKDIAGKTSGGLSSALGAASTAVDLGKTAFGKPAQDTSGLAPSAKVNSGGMIAGSAMKGASAGMAFGPMGAGIGAVVGGVAGLLGSNKAKKAATENASNFTINTNNKLSDNYFAFGGELDPIIENKETWNTKKIVNYQPGVTSGKNGDQGFYLYSKNQTEPGFNVDRDREFVRQENMMDLQRTPQWQQYQQNLRMNKSQPVAQFAYGGKMNQMFDGGDYYENLKLNAKNQDPNNLKLESFLKPVGITVPYTIGTQPTVNVSNANQQFTPGPSNLDMLKYNVSKVGTAINQNAGNIARYAPIAANVLQLAQLKKPQGESLDRLGNRYKPEYVDEASLQNIANQTMNNSVNAIGQSGASQGQLRSSIIGSQLQRTKAISDAYSNAAAQNRATNDRGQSFNADIDRVNLQQSNSEKDINARNQGAYDTEKSKLIGKIGENIGSVGTEQAYKKIAKTTTGYSWLGEFQKMNPNATQEETVIAAKKAGVTIDDKKALGGYLIKNKIK